MNDNTSTGTEDTLTPYDTGARLEPHPWVRDGITGDSFRHPAEPDDYGRVDFDDDDGTTLLTLHVERHLENGNAVFVLRVDANVPVDIEGPDGARFGEVRPHPTGSNSTLPTNTTPEEPARDTYRNAFAARYWALPESIRRLCPRPTGDVIPGGERAWMGQMRQTCLTAATTATHLALECATEIADLIGYPPTDPA